MDVNERYEEARQLIAHTPAKAMDILPTLYEECVAVGAYDKAMKCYVNLAYSYYNVGNIKRAYEMTNDYERLCADFGLAIDCAYYYPLLATQYAALGDKEQCFFYRKAAMTHAHTQYMEEKTEELLLLYFANAKLYAMQLTNDNQFDEALVVVKTIEPFLPFVPSMNVNRVEFYSQYAYIALQKKQLALATQLMDYMRHEPLLQDPNYIRGHGNFFILQMETWRQQQRYDDIYEEGLRILPTLTPIAPLMRLVVEKYKACAVESGNLAFLVAAHQFYITSLKGQLALNTEQELAKRKQQELQYIATHDTLTDVYNRRFLEKEATTYLAQGDRVTMAIFDVDKFKQLNDTYGHAVGDALLVYLGEVAQSHCTVGIQFIARYGGDEFVFVCRGNSLRYRTVFNALQQTTWTYGDITIQLSISMGVAVRQHTSYKELFAAADEALYKAKETRGVLHVEETSIC